MKPKDEIKSLNNALYSELSIDELEERLELDSPKTCGQYNPGPSKPPSH